MVFVLKDLRMEGRQKQFKWDKFAKYQMSGTNNYY